MTHNTQSKSVRAYSVADIQRAAQILFSLARDIDAAGQDAAMAGFSNSAGGFRLQKAEVLRTLEHLEVYRPDALSGYDPTTRSS